MGVSTESGVLRFRPDKGNPGAGQFISKQDRQSHEDVQMHVVTLDEFAVARGWFESRPHIAILKIDVERHEAAVVQGATRLLQSGMVQNIFTEVGTDGDRSENVAALQTFVDAGYYLAGQGNFRGPSEPSLWPQHEVSGEVIMKHLETLGKNHPYLNLWWSLDESKVQDQ